MTTPDGPSNNTPEIPQDGPTAPRQVERPAPDTTRNPEAFYFPEMAIDGFNHRDGTLWFYTFVKAIYTRYPDGPRVLDFGAGRGQWMDRAHLSAYKSGVQDLRDGAAHVTAADVDPVVMENPCSDAQVKLTMGAPLPFDDNSFDVIVADYVFEHLSNPGPIMDELHRVLSPGGWLCFRTPNKWSYVAIAARLIPERLQGKVLHGAQPGRKEEDVFPTVYEINTPAAFRKHLSAFDIHYFGVMGLPSYHFGRRWLYRGLMFLHWLLPPAMATNYMVYARAK